LITATKDNRLSGARAQAEANKAMSTRTMSTKIEKTAKFIEKRRNILAYLPLYYR